MCVCLLYLPVSSSSHALQQFILLPFPFVCLHLCHGSGGDAQLNHVVPVLLTLSLRFPLFSHFLINLSTCTYWQVQVYSGYILTRCLSFSITCLFVSFLSDISPFFSFFPLCVPFHHLNCVQAKVYIRAYLNPLCVSLLHLPVCHSSAPFPLSFHFCFSLNLLSVYLSVPLQLPLLHIFSRYSLRP